MAHKGQLVQPKVPLKQAVEHAMEVIDDCRGKVAVFMVGGEVMCTKSSSQAFENNIKRLASGLVGVYDQTADARVVKADLAEFYRERA